MDDHEEATALVPSLAYPSPASSKSDDQASDTIVSTSAPSESWNSSDWRDERSEDSADLDEGTDLEMKQPGVVSPTQVRRQPNMEHVLDRLTHTLDNANSPLDAFDVDAIRSESIRSFRVIRRRAEQDGIQYAQDYLRVGPGSIHHAL